MLFLDVNKNNTKNAETLQKMLDNKKNIFILVYMIGCTPCKNTLPHWNQLKGCSELKDFEKNDDIVVANIEQSMCEKMHHKELENIMSFPTIKFIKHNKGYDYSNERSKSGFSDWIKQTMQKKNNETLRDIDDLVLNNNNIGNKMNYGNIDMLFNVKPETKKSKSKKNKTNKQIKNKTNKQIKNKTNKQIKNKTNKLEHKKKQNKAKYDIKQTKSEKTVKPKATKETQKQNKAQLKKKESNSKSSIKLSNNDAKSRRIFHNPINYNKK